MDLIHKASLAVALDYLKARMNQGASAPLSATDKNFLAGAARLVLDSDEIRQLDDKSSYVMSFLKSLGLHNIAIVQQSGELPAIDASHKQMLFMALMQCAVAAVQAEFLKVPA